MSRIPILITIPILLLLAACVRPEVRAQEPASSAASAVEAQARPGQHAGSFAASVTETRSMKYLLHLPTEYGDGGRKWPMIVYLHGGSGRGDDPEKLRRMGLPAVVEADPSFPFVVLSPQLPEGQFWPDTEALLPLIDDVIRTHDVDSTRVYLTGHSMGGEGAWYWAYRAPRRFAALLAMSGPGNPWWTGTLGDLPTRVYHGANDEIVPARESEEMAAALREKGGNVELFVLPGRDHFILDLYEDRSLYDWLLRHRR